MNTKLASLADLIGSENLLQDSASLHAYARTANYSDTPGSQLPLAIARPKHPNQFERLLKYCSANCIQVAIRGNATKLCERADFQNKILLVTTGLDRIYEISSANRLVYLEAGVRAETLSKTLLQNNLICPIEPFGTIGGCLASNIASDKTLKYGSISNYVHSLEICLANGSRRIFSANTYTSGNPTRSYPLASLFCGSYGQLGVITRCTLRVLPAPATKAVMLPGFEKLSEAVQASLEILKSPFTPVSLNFYDSVCSQALFCKTDNLLVAEFAGDESEVEAAMKICKSLGTCDMQSEVPLYQTSLLPKLVKTKGFFQLISCTCLPENANLLISAINALAQKYDLKIAIFGSAAIARIHVAVFYPCTSQAIAEFKNSLFTQELMLNNEMESEEDAILTREEWQIKHQSTISYEIKMLFDPGNLLNPALAPGQPNQ